MNDLTIFVLNLQDKLDFTKFTTFVKQKFWGANVVVASKSKHNVDGITEYVFESDNADEVINTLIKKVQPQRMIIVRDFDNNNFERIYSVYSKLKEDNQICLISKNPNKFQNFFMKIFQFIVHFLFGYNLFEGSLEVVAFGKVPVEILKQVDNPSMYTKIDKWSGITISKVQASEIAKVKFKANVTKNIVHILILLATFLTPLLLWILIPFIQKNIALKLLAVFLMALSFSLIIIDALVIAIKHKIGESTYECANIKNKDISPKD